MEVTKTNFEEVLPKIKESVDKSTFLTIDCELTGLSTTNDVNSYDTQKSYYEKVRKGCKDFLVIQYGICTFRYDEKSKSFKHQAFNFYIFPKAVPKHVPDQRFLCQASSIDFLITQNFDFNKLFRDGIPYLNEHQEAKYRDSLKEVQKVRATQASSNNLNESRVVSSKEQDKIFIENVTKSIKDFIKSKDEELVLPKCNGFLQFLVFQLIKHDFDDKVNVKSRDRDKVLVVTKFKGIQDRLDEEKRTVQEEENELDGTIGFSKVIQCITQSGKLVIGHNMCLDLLHTIDKFLIPLPEDYNEFKDCAHMLFSQVLDTKFMSCMDPFKSLITSNVLGHLLETVSKDPFETPRINVESEGYSLEDKREHEAGYDAFITGVAFLAMWRHLGSIENFDYDQNFGNFRLLTPYINKLFLMRLQDTPYIHLGGDDPIPPRDHVFYLTFPKEWKQNDIVQLFSPFGSVHISWINDRSAYVGLAKRNQAAIVLNTLSQSDTYRIMTYDSRQIQLGAASLNKETLTRSKWPEGHATKRRKISERHESDRNQNSDMDSPGKGDAFVDSLITSEPVPIVKPSRKRTISKTFAEDNSWE
ncbi:poly(A)-specific ribonuclease PARN-like [Onthophagus taurus]|uniref:poly(A)-specific ribonuclease PARN-like n=1 Tax=Onthophagus taurus TaxID=166361 RepID=UPI0039BE0F22